MGFVASGAILYLLLRPRCSVRTQAPISIVPYSRRTGLMDGVFEHARPIESKSRGRGWNGNFN
jgi:hypothetical protein